MSFGRASEKRKGGCTGSRAACQGRPDRPSAPVTAGGLIPAGPRAGPGTRKGSALARPRFPGEGAGPLPAVHPGSQAPGHPCNQDPVNSGSHTSGSPGTQATPVRCPRQAPWPCRHQGFKRRAPAAGERTPKPDRPDTPALANGHGIALMRPRGFGATKEPGAEKDPAKDPIERADRAMARTPGSYQASVRARSRRRAIRLQPSAASRIRPRRRNCCGAPSPKAGGHRVRLSWRS
jgi:hypothetical protein